MSDEQDRLGLGRPTGTDFPETPHDLPYNRPRIDELLVRVRNGERIDLLSELLGCVDWRAAFTDDEGNPLTLEEISKLYAYYRKKWSDVGTLYLAELLSSEFMTEQRAQGTLQFSPEFMALGRNNPKLWQEIRSFFRRKEFVTAIFSMADDSVRPSS